MPVLPTFADLQGRDPTAARGVPTTPTSPVGEAWAGFGKSMTNAGFGVASAARDRVEKADKFAAETAFIQFQDQQSQALDEAQRSAAPGASGFSTVARENFKKSGDAFFSTLPENLRAEYGPKLAKLEAGVASSARSFEVKAAEQATVNLVNDGLGRITNRLAGASDADTVTAVMREGREQGELMIDAAPLSPIQKEEAKRSWRVASGEAAVKRLLDVDPTAAQRLLGVVPAGGGDTTAVGLLKRFEGYRATPYWDVNADRVGYGSDTITLADGTIKRVTKDMVVTKEDAERDLMRRIPEFQAGILRDVGSDAWVRMAPNAQAALTSVAYNYGSLPKGVAAAVKTGDAEAVASAIDGLSGHNNGINAKRRRQEAALVRQGGGVATDGPVGDPLLSDLPMAKRAALFADAGLKMKQFEAAVSAENERVYTANLTDLQTRVMDGNAGHTEIQAARDSGWLKEPGAISTLNNIVARREKQAVDITTFAREINNPAFVWNPFETKHVDAVDAGFAAQGGDLNTLQYVVDKTGIMPTSAGKALRGAFVSNDAKKVANAATVSANLLVRNPNVFSSIDGAKEIEDNAVAFRQYTEHFGMTAEDAAKKIIQNQSPEYKAQVKARLKVEDVDAIIRKQGSDGTLQKDLVKGFDQAWFSDPVLERNPAARNSAMTDFAELVKEKYLETGDMAVAKTQAQAQFKKVWGVSAVNGKDTIMRFPPERAPVFAGIPDVSTKIAEQAIAAVSEASGYKPERGKIFLTPTPGGETARAYMSNQPVPYAMSWFDKNGVLQSLPRGKAFVADPVTMRAKVSEERRASLESKARTGTAPIDPNADAMPFGVGSEIEAGLANR